VGHSYVGKTVGGRIHDVAFDDVLVDETDDGLRS
jgi:hypothetical protein